MHSLLEMTRFVDGERVSVAGRRDLSAPARAGSSPPAHRPTLRGRSVRSHHGGRGKAVPMGIRWMRWGAGQRSPEGGSRDRCWWVVPALALACATYLVLSLYETLHPGRLGGLGALFDRLGVFPPFLLVVVAVGIVGFRGDLPPADGRAWRTLAGALALDLLAQVLWLSLPPGYQPVVVGAESLAYAGMFRALLALPSPLRHSR